MKELAHGALGGKVEARPALVDRDGGDGGEALEGIYI